VNEKSGHEDTGSYEVKSVQGNECQVAASKLKYLLLEEFVLGITKYSPARKDKICLWNKRSNASPVPWCGPPVQLHLAILDGHGNKREGVNQGWDDWIYSILTGNYCARYRRTHDGSQPAMKNLKLLVRCTRESSNIVDFG
jgi:hypothetical protein